MTISPITPTYAVSAQIDPSDFASIAAAGYKTVICNRPDAENPPHLQAAAMAEAAQKAGVDFKVLPLTHQTMTPENVAKQFEYVANAGGPVLAYCASGTRCSVIWALSQAGKQSADDILAQTAKAGYDLSGLRGALG
ncbi:MAG: TIGR01244 family sulfur transferase [Planktotalea sp.]|uniref:TIGR01244 family sulfur transferase n=1 Tax=Planktotalea sp. TaxID=2029877 RepID=UPI003C777A17